MQECNGQRLLKRALRASALALLALGSPVSAEEARWTLRGGAAWTSPTGDDLGAVLSNGAPFRLAVDDGLGLAAELEYRVRPRVGVELGAFAADLGTDFRILAGDQAAFIKKDAAFELIGLGMNLHLWPGHATDLHVGLFAAIMNFDLRRPELAFDDDVGFGAKIGFDRRLGGDGPWSASASARYMRAILEGEVAGQDTDFNPLVVTAGISYRF